MIRILSILHKVWNEAQHCNIIQHTVQSSFSVSNCCSALDDRQRAHDSTLVSRLMRCLITLLSFSLATTPQLNNSETNDGSVSVPVM